MAPLFERVTPPPDKAESRSPNVGAETIRVAPTAIAFLGKEMAAVDKELERVAGEDPMRQALPGVKIEDMDRIYGERKAAHEEGVRELQARRARYTLAWEALTQGDRGPVKEIVRDELEFAQRQSADASAVGGSDADHREELERRVKDLSALAASLA